MSVPVSSDGETGKDLKLCDVFMFLTDLITYALEKVGLQWEWTIPIADCLRLFHPEQGDATLRYRNCWDEQFRVGIRQHTLKHILHPAAMRAYVERYAVQCFEKQPAANIPGRFFLFSAFLVDLAIFCFRYDQQDLINTALCGTGVAYDRYLKNVPSGVFWHTLMDVAVETSRMAGRSS